MATRRPPTDDDAPGARLAGPRARRLLLAADRDGYLHRPRARRGSCRSTPARDADASPDGPHDAGDAEAAPLSDAASDAAEASTPTPPDAEGGRRRASSRSARCRVTFSSRRRARSTSPGARRAGVVCLLPPRRDGHSRCGKARDRRAHGRRRRGRGPGRPLGRRVHGCADRPADGARPHRSTPRSAR